MSGKSVFGGLAKIRPDYVGEIGNEYHPGGQGSNVYHLIRVPTPNGPQLVGAMSKGSGIINFTTGETIHDFSDLGPGPMLAPGSYAGEQALWTNPVDGVTRLYLGGWVKRPAIVGATNNHTNKYGWVGEYSINGPRIEFIRYLVLDKAQAADSWQGEVSQLIPTQERLFILRGDIELGSAPSLASLNGYTYSWDGTNVSGTAPTVTTAAGTVTLNANVTLFENVQSVKGGIYGDALLLANAGTNVSVFDLVNASYAKTTTSFSGITVRALGGSTKAVSSTFRSEFAQLGGMLFHGTTNGYFLGDPRVAGDCVFMPMLATPNGGAGLVRAFGWRARIIEAEGGLIVPVNSDLFGRTDAIQSFLLWIGHGGTVKVLRTGGSFAGVEVHDGRLYYGVSNEPHTDVYSNYKNCRPQLASMALEDIHTAPPPSFTERISHTAYTAGSSGTSGYLGGYPTLGYKDGSLWLKSSTAGTLTLSCWSVGKGSSSDTVRRDVGTVVFAAGDTKYVDLASLEGLDRTGGLGRVLGGGDVFGWKFSVNTSLIGAVSLSA